jgi:predicted O-methyltransferase YrrM
VKHFFQTVPGWFDFSDLYGEMVKRAKDGARFVETGVYLGKSAAFMAVEIANSRKAITFDAYDTFQGVSEPFWKGVPAADDFRYADQEADRDADGLMLTEARRNLEPVRDIVSLHVSDGIEAAGRHADASLDFVFLDDNHETVHVAKEMAAWWPKVKPGGILAGHDIDWASVSAAVLRWSKRTGRLSESISQRCWMVEKPIPAQTWIVPPKSRSCLVAVCCNERNIPRHTAESLVRIGWGQRVTNAMKRHGFTSVDFTWTSRYVSVADIRDEAVLTAFRGEYSHILFLDADMVWPADVLDKMLRHHGRGIVSGLYHLKTWPHWPVALKGAVWNEADQNYDYHYDEKVVSGDDMLRSQQLVGMGCTLVPMELFRRYERPWFKYQLDGEGTSTITEDVYFCQQAQALGCPIWLDPSVECGHISQQPITGAWFDRATYEMQMLSAGQRLSRQPAEAEAVSV